MKIGKTKKHPDMTWFSQGLEPNCWSYPICLSLTTDVDRFPKLHTELLCRCIPTYNYGYGCQEKKEAGQGKL